VKNDEMNEYIEDKVSS